MTLYSRKFLNHRNPINKAKIFRYTNHKSVVEKQSQAIQNELEKLDRKFANQFESGKPCSILLKIRYFEIILYTLDLMLFRSIKCEHDQE
jgi:hypothetical protein